MNAKTLIHRPLFLITAVMLLMLCSAMSGQQTQSYTQYMFNRYLLNPAACASNGYTTVGLTVKDQWTGLKGAPSNQVLSAQIRWPKNGVFGTRGSSTAFGYAQGNVGVGISLFNDTRGAIRTTGGQITYAYHFEIETGQLSLGLALNMFQLYIDRNNLVTEHPDAYLNGAKLNTLIPDALFGVHYTTPDWYAGVSIANLFQSGNSSVYRTDRQYNVLGGYVARMDEEWSFVPAVMVKFNDKLVAQADFNALLYYTDFVWGGVAYRTGGGGVPGGVNAMIGFGYKNYSIGYSYDYTLASISRYAFGSHELMATITLGQSERYFRHANVYKFKATEGSGRLRGRNYGRWKW
ncbi:membrane protein [Bacteroidia bacterium]|nr:membrane protein [Bacteroidia bacterium]